MRAAVPSPHASLSPISKGLGDLLSPADSDVVSWDGASRCWSSRSLSTSTRRALAQELVDPAPASPPAADMHAVAPAKAVPPTPGTASSASGRAGAPPLFRLRVWLALLALKLLLFPAYRSTDFEVHRNWLAITHSLPLAKWYVEATSQWTLDYPPLFAWMEWALSWPAKLLDPQMLVVDNLEYASVPTVYYQRSTVIATELLLVAVATTCYSKRGARSWHAAATFALLVANPGLLIVDHIHFQYNGLLLGLFLASIALITRGYDVLGGLAFAALVNAKHLFAVAGPLYATYLLRRICRGPRSLLRFATLAAGVAAVCAASLGPHAAAGQLPALLARLFPFERGLLHAYWAPNFWALYAAADKAAAALAPRLGVGHWVAAGGAAGGASMTGGLVGGQHFAVLPEVGGGTTAALSLAAMAPCLLHVWRRPKQGAFLDAAVYVALTSFLFGYHVHEKAILTATVPMAAGALRSPDTGGRFLMLATLGNWALMTLLFTPAEYPIKVLLVAGYALASYVALYCILSADCGGGWVYLLSRGEYRYLWGLGVLELYCTALHPWLLAGRLPFLPLLLTSVYCAAGVVWVWGRMAARYVWPTKDGA